MKRLNDIKHFASLATGIFVLFLLVAFYGFNTTDQISFLSIFQGTLFSHIPYNNSYFPVFSEFKSLLNYQNLIKYQKYYCIIFISLYYFKIFSLVPNSYISKTLYSFLSTLVILQVIGTDLVHWYFISFTIFFISNIKENGGYLFSTLLFAAITLLSPTLAILSLALSLFFVGNIDNFIKTKFILSIFILVIALVSTSQVPLPNYPSSSHLVPEDGYSYRTMPLVGDFFSSPTINRPHEKLFLKPIASALIIISILYSVILLLKKYNANLIIPIFSLILAADLLLPESLAAISPLQTLRRVIPDSFNMSFSSFFLVLTILLVTIKNIQFKISSLALILLLLVFTVFPENRLSFAKLAPLAFHDTIKIADRNPALADRIFSPSFYLIKKEGSAIFDNINKELEWVGVRKFSKNIKISWHKDGEPKGHRKMFNNNPNTRFTVARNGQKGGEYFCLEFNTPIEVKALLMNSGYFPLDYPRGIETFTSIDKPCSKLITNLPSSIQTDSTLWRGSISFTNNAKPYPYYGQLNEVIINIDPKEPVKSILIRQTHSSEYDWSIASLKFGISQ